MNACGIRKASRAAIVTLALGSWATGSFAADSASSVGNAAGTTAKTAKSAASGPSATAPAASPAELARQQIHAAVTRDWPRLRELYSADVVYVDPGGEYQGIDAALKNLERSLQPFGGKIDANIHRIYDGKDFAVAEWSAVAVNDSEFTLADGSKAPATGNEVNLSVITIFDVKDGKIVGERNYYDGLALYGSLGLLGD